MRRREALRWMAGWAAALAGAACTPLRIVTRSFPAAFKDDPLLVRRALRAFVTAVIPGIDPTHPDVPRALLDRRYPFARYAGFFASDLSQRAERLFGSEFDGLTVAQRTAVIEDGLASDSTTRQLYRGAIYLTQVSIYAGIYDDDTGCRLIDYCGRYRGEATSYEDPDRFLAPPLTANGNWA